MKPGKRVRYFQGLSNLSWLIKPAAMVMIFITSQALSLGNNNYCSDGLGLNYTLPMFDQCKMIHRNDGSLVQTIPKLIPSSDLDDTRCKKNSKHMIPQGKRVCRPPDCTNESCLNGWCEETMTGYHCHIMESNNTKNKTSPTTPQHTTTTTPQHTTATTRQHTTSATTEGATSEPVARCPDGWLDGHISNKCYFLEPDAFWWFTWYEAKNACADINVTDPYGYNITAQILVLESVDEMLELKQKVIDAYQLWYDNWWYRMGLWLNCIGIWDVEDKEMFYCETNDEMIPMQYLDWGPGEPSHENVTGDILQDCVSTWNYYWPYVWTLQDRSCEHHRAATICQIPRFEDNATEATQSSVTTEPTKSSPSTSITHGISEPQARCPVNWYEGENECYYISSAWSYHWDIRDVSFHFFWFTWYNARDLCAGMDVIDHNGRVTNPQLLVLESDEEMLELRQILLDSYEIWFGTSGWVWLNCNDMEEEGTFYCVKNGENITLPYTNWAENKPDDNVTDSVPENCIGTFGYWPFEWTLDDVNCNDINFDGIMICEINKF